MTLIDITLFILLLGAFVFITGSIWKGVRGEKEYRYLMWRMEQAYRPATKHLEKRLKEAKEEELSHRKLIDCESDWE